MVSPRSLRGGRLSRGVVVAGAGLAGLRLAEALRRGGHEAPVTLVGDEDELPYDRPPLSKEVLAGSREPDATTLRDARQLAELDLRLELGVAATGIDLGTQELEVGGQRIAFDALVIATGASPRRLPELEERENVFVLRTSSDARAIRDAMTDGRRVAVVGGGVIGCEVAASARARGLDVAIVEAAPAIMTRSVGATLGAVFADLHRREGIDVHTGVRIEAVEGEARVSRLRLSDGSVLEPDLVVVGVGVNPNSSWLARSGLELGDGVVCDETLNAGHPAVYAIGDVASWPNPLAAQRMRCEQWTNAVEQARHVARNLLQGPGELAAFASSNYFWSDQYRRRMQFAGSPRADDVIVVDGSFDEGRFLAWYRRGDRLVGACAVDSAKLLMQSKGFVEAGLGWDEACRGLSA